MIIPWFSEGTAHGFSYLSLFSLASVLDVYVKQGRHRALVTAVFGFGACLGISLFVLAMIAASTGQPHYISRSLGIAGFVMSVVFIVVFLNLRRCYTKAELRQIAAREI
jgi:hypothetical protein